MRVELITTGNELLIGHTINTNAAWIGEQLFSLGISLQRHVTAPDGEVLKEVFADSLERSDCVIITGGLGPTSDDLTRDYVAELLNLEMIQDEQAVRSLEAFFAKRDRDMPADNYKQTLCPVGAEILENHMGTAPGLWFPEVITGKYNCAIVLLPGPPIELKPLFIDEVMPKLKSRLIGSEETHYKELRFMEVGESDFHQVLDDKFAAIADLEVGYCSRLVEIDLRLLGSQEAIAQAAKLAQAAFTSYYLSDTKQSIEALVIEKATQAGKTVSVAESCTGGLISHRLTNIAGASAVIKQNWVTYCNQAKHDSLGVSNTSLECHGAVSEQVAQEMAMGALTKATADYGIGVTGIAGPDGGTEDKPVGLAYIGLAQKDSNGDVTASVIKVYSPRSRESFKQVVSQKALFALYKAIS